MHLHTYGLPWWLSGKKSACQCWRPGFSPWVGKIPWRRAWQPTLVLLLRESHGWRSLSSCSSQGRTNASEATKQQHRHTNNIYNTETIIKYL